MYEYTCINELEGPKGRKKYILQNKATGENMVVFQTGLKDMVKNGLVDNIAVRSGKIHFIVSFRARGIALLEGIGESKTIQAYYKQEGHSDTYNVKFYNMANEDITYQIAFLIDRKVKKTGYLSVSCGGISPVEAIMMSVDIVLQQLGLIQDRLSVNTIYKPIRNARVRYNY